MSSQPFSHREAANSSIIVQCRHAALVIFMMQGQKSLTLHWRSCLGHSPDVGTTMFRLERRAIVRLWVKDAVKPSVFSMMQCQKSLTLRWRSFLGGSSDIVYSIFAYKGRQYYDFGLNAAAQPSYYPGCRTRNRWRSVDAHFYHGAICVWLSIFPTKPANTSSLDGCDCAAWWLLNRYDYKSLKLRWHSPLSLP